jgi:menaquinone-dependent protoporphyrinogen oxidase
MIDTFLVAYATRRGSTREVADAIGRQLGEHDLLVEVRPADHVDDLSRYCGVVLGGALYPGRLHRDARDFLRRHRESLARTPFAIFAMGPATLDPGDVARSRAQLEKALRRLPELRPFATAIFGGVVDPAKLSFPFRAMPAGDARDWDAIEIWADGVAAAFEHAASAASV